MSQVAPKVDLEEASSLQTNDVLQRLSVDIKQGLDSSTVKKRRKKYGENRLQEFQRRSAWQILIAQFKSPIIALLAVAAVLSFAFQEWIEGIAIIIAILLNAIIGFVTETKAVRSMESLQKLSKTKAKVRRNNQVQEIDAEQLVPGDIVILDGGDLVAADLRLLEASKLQADESALTGESVPVSKTIEPLEKELEIADRRNMVFKGTAITRGSGEGVVVSTGMDTELGHISSLTAQAEEEITPLEKRLDSLGKRLIWITLLIAVVIAGVGIVSGRDLYTMVETAIALSVAAVPEGLPIVATVALARGMWRMAKRNAIINRLSAVETLGATSIICTDKTGTLTENRMTAREIMLWSDSIEITGEEQTKGQFRRDDQTIDPLDNSILRNLLNVCVLCNNATLAVEEGGKENQDVGDPTEIALVALAAKADLNRNKQREQKPEVREEAFDTQTKMMATFHEVEGRYWVAVKGAPESVLPVCSHYATIDQTQEMDTETYQTWQDKCHSLAQDGLRILAIAQKTVDNSDSEPYQNLTLLGVVGLLDPPREAVKKALKACHEAGIRPIMVTGDQPVTARNIGLAVGLTTEKERDAQLGKALKNPDDIPSDQQEALRQVPIFARVSPEQKLNLITLHQQAGAVVGMTGDGVNDAPALKKADIGIAMGQRGTQVAKEAADMILQDDAFSTIVAAVEQGRAIFNNIRKFTIYLLSGNVGEIMAVAFASLTDAPLPLLPLQILFLNAVNDVFPALALGVGEGNPHLMEHPPRDSKEPILTKGHWLAIVLYGLLISAPVLGIFFYAFYRLGFGERQAVTISFLALAFGRLWHVFNMRDTDGGLIHNEISQNPYIWAALLICTGLLLSAVYLPGLSGALQTVDPGVKGWAMAIAASFIPVIVGQIVKLIRK
ncbi:cation-translocating P-type ATPase [Crocosphaera chwakensis]|uniref:Cation-transporting ATPase, calcium-transporting ATPase n=1 Tax=Crocosphaera chwakensis CCY0110 TaxID=391612 RepID=A3IV87_9CHRO|nr:cation-transporting P-type ATPase [Crocosphaera chwakensis]EAZ89648.1 cation-transporting ATPase, calcium-transporting ATPase [Crocosphaera chwakensis CCY0110]